MLKSIFKIFKYILNSTTYCSLFLFAVYMIQINFLFKIIYILSSLPILIYLLYLSLTFPCFSSRFYLCIIIYFSSGLNFISFIDISLILPQPKSATLFPYSPRISFIMATRNYNAEILGRQMSLPLLT